MRGAIRSRRRILIVDDDRSIVDGIARVLRDHPAGYIVETSDQPAAAVALVRTFEPDLLLLDAVMPDCHGAELCRRAAAVCRGQLPKVIIISGFSPSQLPLDEIGTADLYLTKPVDVPVLLDSIDRLLGGRASAAS